MQVIRKHNRRAAKAAFSIAFGVALILGLVACGGSDSESEGEPPAQGTTIIVGAKNFPEQYVLGQLYRQALMAKGFEVEYKENIGSTELIDTALREGQVNVYPEYTGIMLSVTHGEETLPDSAEETYDRAKELYEERGQTLGEQTPFQDRDVIAVTRETADEYGLETMADLSEVPNLTLAGFPEWEERWTGPIEDVYGVSGFRFVPLAGISAYQLLDQGDVLAADVFTTDPQLLSEDYVELEDPENMFGFQHVAPVIDQGLVDEYGDTLTSTLDEVSGLLTTEAMQEMIKAVAIDKQSAETVAAEFLEANDLG
jgi:osmoprotectant transport system substrate-binding protein